VLILLASILNHEVSLIHNPKLYVNLAMTTTFFSSGFQASLGIFRLGFIIYLLSHTTIMEFMVKPLLCPFNNSKASSNLRILHIRQIIYIIHSVLEQVDKWRWESIVLRLFFLIFILVTHYINKKNPRLFWISISTPLIFGNKHNCRPSEENNANS
jgi:MFS superfamily sulfate permease-like transporter